MRTLTHSEFLLPMNYTAISVVRDRTWLLCLFPCLLQSLCLVRIFAGGSFLLALIVWTICKLIKFILKVWLNYLMAIKKKKKLFVVLWPQFPFSMDRRIQSVSIRTGLEVPWLSRVLSTRQMAFKSTFVSCQIIRASSAPAPQLQSFSKQQQASLSETTKRSAADSAA